MKIFELIYSPLSFVARKEPSLITRDHLWTFCLKIHALN